MVLMYLLKTSMCIALPLKATPHTIAVCAFLAPYALLLKLAFGRNVYVGNVVNRQCTNHKVAFRVQIICKMKSK